MTRVAHNGYNDGISTFPILTKSNVFPPDKPVFRVNANSTIAESNVQVKSLKSYVTKSIFAFTVQKDDVRSRRILVALHKREL